MHILVLLKMVPDVVEDLEIASDGKALDADYVRMIPSESDEHALEQALLLKDKVGGSVTVLAIESRDVDEVLFTALAKGADRAVKVAAGDAVFTAAEAAALLARVLPVVPNLMPVQLIVTGCQAIDDLDGVVAPALAERLKLPYLGIVTGVEVAADGSRATVFKEYAGGTRGRYAVCLPALLGVQAAPKPPRYVPVAKVRAAMKARTLECVQAPAKEEASFLEIVAMAKPQAAGRAEMLEGSPEEVASKVAEILSSRGLA